MAQHAEAPHLRLLQKELARLLTIFVHSESDYDFAVKASEILFGNNTADMLRSLDERQLLEVLDGVDQVKITRE